MYKRALAVAAERELSGVGSSVGDQVVDVLERYARVHHQCKKVRHQHRNRREVLERVVGYFLKRDWCDHHVAALAAGERVTVGRGLRQ
jgi:hypothetical protein